jgi:hypothetical protein
MRKRFNASWRDLLLCCEPPNLAAGPGLYNRISLIPQLSTDILPLVGYGGKLPVESRKNGHFFRGIIWWNYLVGSTEFSRPPAHPPAAAPPRAPPRALGSGHPSPHRGAPFAARSLCFLAAGQRTESRMFIRDSVRFGLLLKLQMIPPRKLPTSKPTFKAHISPLPTNGITSRRCAVA